MRRASAFMMVLAVLVIAGVAGAAPAGTAEAGTRVPGHEQARYDRDGNGYPDAGVYVNGHYTSVYAYDAGGDWYWDLGDGRVYGTVGAVENLEAATLTRCDYVINYRADFGNDPFMNEGWIQNHINCSGYDDNGQYNYLIVSQADPRYTGNPDWAVWGTWEYHVLTESGSGNLVKAGPQNHLP
ncbi:MAG: hypothetical protein Q8M79_11535 [Dehalococcoidia bacterium]|nr:hypothetical protein [Dehalococcoidia bacterium]